MNLHAIRSVSLTLLAASLLAACAGQQDSASLMQQKVKLVARADIPMPVMKPLSLPTRIPGVGGASKPVQDRSDIVTDSQRYSCVPFARMWSGIDLYGNGGSWWAHAQGKYPRAHKPETGSVIVFAATRRLRVGHVAVVRRVISDREISIDHANWGNRGKVYLNAKVVDVSPNNDWSEVRVWNTALGVLGTHVYRVHGFILPKPDVAKTASLDIRGSRLD